MEQVNDPSEFHSYAIEGGNRLMLEKYKNLPIPFRAGYRKEKDARKYFEENDSPLLFYELTNEQQKSVVDWSKQFDQIKGFQHHVTSYGMKHDFERSRGGFYMTNGAFKGAMVVAGFKVEDETELNWFFNISKRSYNKMWKETYD